jgi:hypothetical protein
MLLLYMTSGRPKSLLDDLLVSGKEPVLLGNFVFILAAKDLLPLLEPGFQEIVDLFPLRDVLVSVLITRELLLGLCGEHRQSETLSRRNPLECLVQFALPVPKPLRGGAWRRRSFCFNIARPVRLTS